MNFNTKRFRELLKESILLDQEGKSLLSSNQTKYDELDEYLIILLSYCKMTLFGKVEKNISKLLTNLLIKKLLLTNFTRNIVIYDNQILQHMKDIKKI